MFRLSLLMLTSLSLTACGGGLGSLFANPTTVQLQSTASESGYAWSSGSLIKSTAAQILVGDNSGNDTAHGFVRFSLATIPAGATITEARLVMGQELVWGAPYGAIGPTLRVDHLDMGAGFNFADMAAPTIISLDMSVLSFDPAAEAKDADVEPALDFAVSHNMPYVDFRLRFDQGSNFDGLFDLAWFNNEADSGGSGIRPTLVVTYE